MSDRALSLTPLADLAQALIAQACKRGYRICTRVQAHMTTPTQTRVLTAIVGSYPKPRTIYRKSGRALLDRFGFSFDCCRNEVGQPEFANLSLAAQEVNARATSAGTPALRRSGAGR